MAEFIPVKLSRTSKHVLPEENTEDRICNEILIDITVKDKTASKIDTVLRFINGLMNTDGGEIKLVNIKYDKAEPKNFDTWLKKLEEALDVPTSSKYLKWHCDSEDLEFSKPGKQLCNTEKLYLRVKPKTDELNTIKTYLYMPRMTDVVPVDVEDAFKILNNTDFSHTLRALPPYSKNFVYGEVHHDARNESDTIQFKEINEKVSNIPKRISDDAERYLSAFCNHNGGRIIFGIKDESSKVVGVKLTEKNKKEIEETMVRKMERFWYGYTKRPVRKDHWDIEFHNVAQPDGLTMEEGKTLEVIVVSVSKFPGGVFTASPAAYYVDVNDGCIKQYGFEAWIKEMERRRNANLCDRLVFSEVRSDPQYNNPGVLPTNVPLEVYQPETSNVFDHHDVPDRIETRNFSKLDAILKAHNCVTIQGYLGTGKSTLALTMALSKKGKGNVVWKMDCSTNESMIRSIAELGDCLECKVRYTDNTAENILLVGRSIVGSLSLLKGQHLLLFEDVTQETKKVTENFVRTYLLGKQDINVKVIVTSTLQVVGELLHITGLTTEEAIKFISTIDGTDEDKQELCQFYSNNPLGLEIARQYIKVCRISVQQFLRILKEETRGEISVEDNPAIADVKPLFKSILHILKEMSETNPSGFQKMLLLKFLNTEEIPVILLHKAISFLTPDGRTSGVMCDNILGTMINYAFGTIARTGNERVLHTHGIILEAMKRFEGSALEMFEEESKYSEVLALLKSIMCLINKDNRMDLEKHISILPHAVSILNHALISLNETADESIKGNAEFLLPLLYVADLVGYTFDFKEMHVEGEKYYEIARKCFIHLTTFDINTYDALDDIALRLYRKMISTYKNNKTTLNKIGKEFVLNKFRSKDEIELLKKHLPVEGPFLENQEYENLCRKSLAVPDHMIGKYVFFEVVISFLYSYGRRTFYTSKERKDEILRYRHYLLVAYHLCKIFHAGDTKFIMIHQMLTRRNGYIQEALLRNLEEDEIEKLMAECMAGVNDKTKYYLFGTLYLDASSEAFSKALWLKQLVNWYCKRLENVNKDDSEKKGKIISEGRSRVEELLEEIRGLKTTSAFPGLLLVVGKFYKHAEAYDDARKCFHEITSLVRYEEEQYPRHQRLAYVGIAECNLLDSKTKLEDLRESILTCSKTTLGYRNEQEKLETVLFNGSQPDASKKQYQACIEYLSTRLSYLDNDTLCIDKKVMTEEISELWKKLETMNVQGSCQELQELRRKMKNLTV